MANGTWTTQNKVSPGTYINFKSAARAVGTVGERGVAAFPAPLPWGPEGVIKLEAESFLQNAEKLLGFGAADARIRHIAAAMAHASRVLIYRLGAKGSEQAKATVGELTATANYGGTRGNDLQIIVQASVDEPDHYEVRTLLEGEEVDAQIVGSIEELVNHDFVTFTGSGELTETAGAALAGGVDGPVSNGDWTAALAALEAEEFDVLGVPTDDAAIKQLAVAYTKRLREQEGKKIVTVLYNHPQANYEGIISLKNSIITTDGLAVEPIYLLWEITAMEAAANVNESLTYTEIPNAADVSPKMTYSEMIQALQNGELVLTASNGKVQIQQDINTLTTFTPEKAKHFSKNRVVRVLDTIARDLQRTFASSYLGKIGNNADGRNLLKGEVLSYLGSLQGIGAIQNFDAESDLEVLPGNEGDAVVINLNVQPVDSIEKIYMTVTVN
ncbi:phage tail sheath family protein [Paenibacillus antibioticophila]|uniref:phage tail sheath family protein n=1 Tax=Paenibacillus antibioticophila TaxID=1274374 RepID=UPI0005C9D1F4|nr:phage tail sheath family protein [Paenibacillus antibioticophila]